MAFEKNSAWKEGITMNYRKANWGFLGMVLTHFAVIIALLIGRVTSMGMMTICS